MVLMTYSQKNRKTQAVTLAAALYARASLPPEEPVPGLSSTKGCRADTAHLTVRSTAAAATQVVKVDIRIDWKYFARGSIESDRNEIMATR
jgi:hypothetical protein